MLKDPARRVDGRFSEIHSKGGRWRNDWFLAMRRSKGYYGNTISSLEKKIKREVE